VFRIAVAGGDQVEGEASLTGTRAWGERVGKKHKQVKPGKTPAGTVRKLIKAGKVKKKCCRSESRCKRCPVLALKKAKKEWEKKAA
jgi:hypothetical protein